jgi:hypothetical protein
MRNSLPILPNPLKLLFSKTRYITLFLIPCPNWTIDYHNISTILNDFTKVLRHADGTWTDENNRPLACELEYCGVETPEFLFELTKEAHFWNL